MKRQIEERGEQMGRLMRRWLEESGGRDKETERERERRGNGRERHKKKENGRWRDSEKKMGGGR